MKFIKKTTILELLFPRLQIYSFNRVVHTSQSRCTPFFKVVKIYIRREGRSHRGTFSDRISQPNCYDRIPADVISRVWMPKRKKILVFEHAIINCRKMSQKPPFCHYPAGLDMGGPRKFCQRGSKDNVLFCFS